MTITRRQALQAIGVAAGALTTQACGWFGSRDEDGCAALRGRRVRWIVAAGDASDAKLLAGRLQKQLSAEFELVNRRGIDGARAVASAAADGLTLGTVGLSSLLIRPGRGREQGLNPATDFTILGRLSLSPLVWAAGPRTAVRSIDDLAAISAARPLVFAMAPGSGVNVMAIAVAAHLLGVRVELADGFKGAGEATGAARKGQADLVCFAHNALRRWYRSGELTPVLQISSQPIGKAKALAGVAVLGGTSGAAVARARALGNDEAAAQRTADALARVTSGARLVVAPPRMDADLAACLAGAVHAAASEGQDRRAAARFDPAPAETARADVQLAVKDAPALVNTARPLLTSLRRRTSPA